MPYTLHLVSHTHWDREWYLPYQQFRLRLVHLVDRLLDLLHTTPEFKHFMLDGQTIILDDYLDVRPHRAADLERHIREGRILIGPWHVLADEFLVHPESLVRNLLVGRRKARAFGQPMPVGYLPDLFGHIGQMPQILRGFGLERAALRRGLADEPAELWWESPDGSRVFLAYLRDGYDNAAALPTHDPDALAETLRRLRDSLAPHVHTSHILLMNGTDHHEAQPDLPAALAALNYHLDGDVILHTTLPAYMDAVLQECQDFPTVRGELRNPKRHHLLPGVLSTRTWIKQRNHASETLLLRWAEPFSLWADDLPPRPPRAMLTGLVPLERLEYPEDVLRVAWEILLQNHPHDSICGCSVDAVHREMRTRFDQVDQIAEELVRQSLQAIADEVDTRHPTARRALVAFNPTPWPHTGWVEFHGHLPGSLDTFAVVDEEGHALPVEVLHQERHIFGEMTVSREQGIGLAAMAREGTIMGHSLTELYWHREGSTLHVIATLDPQASPAPGIDAQVNALLAEVKRTPDVEHIHLLAYLSTDVRGRVLVTQVPPLGYRTLWLIPHPQKDNAFPASPSPKDAPVIRNEIFTLRADPETGLLTLTDHRTGATFSNLHEFEDEGDRGDTYNYDAPRHNPRITRPIRPPRMTVEREEGRETLLIEQTFRVPAALAPDREARSDAHVPLHITTRVTLSRGIPRVDFETTVENRARDHCLRVRFPAPFVTDHAHHDGHYHIVTRPVPYTRQWISPDHEADLSAFVEMPVNTVPQRDFTAISNGQLSLVLANRGLPEIEVIPGDGETTLALTLLRCVGWLSRGDLRSRRGDAGPMLETPEAQNLGTWTFHYSLIPWDGDWQAAARVAWQFAAPMRGMVTDVHPGAWPRARSLLTADDPHFVITGVKRAEDGDGWIVRGYNATAVARDVTLRPWRPFPVAYRARMDETTIAPLTVTTDGEVALHVGPWEIATVRFTDQKKATPQ